MMRNGKRQQRKRRHNQGEGRRGPIATTCALLPGPDGLSFTMLIILAPIPSKKGEGESVVMTMTRQEMTPMEELKSHPGLLEQTATDLLQEIRQMVETFLRTEFTPSAEVAFPGHSRLRQPTQSCVFRLGDLAINYAERSVSVAGRTVDPPLPPNVYKLLVELSRHPGQVLSYDQLLQRVWGADYVGDPRLVRNVVMRLRRALGDDARAPKYVITRPGVGYFMKKAEDRGRISSVSP